MKVLHFVRKSSQLKASFVKTQIEHHKLFEPCIVFRKKISEEHDNDFADFDLSTCKYLDLSYNETFFESIKYRVVKTLSARQINLIEDFIKQNKIDICHFHYGTDCGVFYPLIKQLDIPSVVSFYGYDAFSFPKKFLGYGKNYLKNRVFDHITKVLAMSPEMKNDLLKIGCLEKKIIIHYYGVPSSLFKNIKKSYDQANRDFTLFNLSYFDPFKGHLFIFKAIKELISRGDINVKLRIAGQGFFERTLKKYVHENHLNEFVTFLGPLKYGSKEMISEFENADAFIHPSVITKNDKEGIPGAVVEAIFAGLPVVSTFHGGIPYVIENERTGLLVKEWDINALADKIKLLIDNSELRKRLGQAGQKFAIENLDLLKKEDELESIYKSLLS